MKLSSLHEILIIRDEIFLCRKNGYKTDGEFGIYATKINMYQKKERETICKFQIHTK